MSGLGIPLLVAAAVRIAYWMQVHDEAWFIFPGTDPAFYTEWAGAILNGKGSLFIPFPRAPLYPYILAGIQKLFGSGWLWFRLLNLAADICTISMIYLLSYKIHGKKAAIISSTLFALSGSAIYFSGEILMTSLATMLFLGFLLLYTASFTSRHLLTVIASGVLIGITALLRPNILALLPFTATILILHDHKQNEKPRRIFERTASHILAAIIILLPVTIINWQATHRFVPVSLQGGVNFYIGNAKNANGWASWLPGAGAAWTEEDAAHIAEVDAGRQLHVTEVSRQLWSKGFREIKSAPFSWMRLMLKKSLLLVNYREIGNNRPLSLAKDASPMLRLFFPISIGLLLPLAAVGFLTTRKNKIAQLVFFFGAVYGATLLIFFINSRYRMPLTPLFCIFAGIGLLSIWNSILERKVEATLVSAFVIGSLIAFPNWAGDKFEEPVQAEYIAGNALMRMGRIDEAITRYENALKLAPDFPELHLNYGAALMEAGNIAAAIQEFQAELRNNPGSAKAMNNLGVAEEKSGNTERAQQYYQSAVETAPHLEDARINLARIYKNQAHANPNDPKPWYGLAVIAGMQGNWEGARYLLGESLKRDSGYQPAIDLLKGIEAMD